MPQSPPTPDAPQPHGAAPAQELLLWHVAVTFAGPPVDPEALRAGLIRLSEERPFVFSIRYAANCAEIRYWDEAEDLDDAAAIALRLWGEHRASAGLPSWRAAGLEILDRTVRRERDERVGQGPGHGVGRPLRTVEMGDIHPF